MKAVLPLAALLLGALLLAPAVAAQDEWGDGERTLQVEERADGFELRSDRSQGETRDRIRLEMDGRNVRFDFDLRESASAVGTEASLRVELRRVFEFRDENRDGAYEAGERVVQEYDRSDIVLTGVASAGVMSGGVRGVQVTATYAVSGWPGSAVAFRATAFGDLTTFQRLQQRPVEIKVDLLFRNFPLSDRDTLPAVEIKASGEAPGGLAVAPDEVSFTSGTLGAIFRWKDTALVDGVDRPVGVTTVRQPDEVTSEGRESVLSVTFAYPRGAIIVHDPTFGFSLRVLLGNAGFYALGAVAAAAVFVGLAALRKVRNLKRR